LAEDLNSRLAPYAGRSGHMKLLKAFLRKAAEGMTTEEVKARGGRMGGSV
jgi:translation initiation factor 3 subunit J